MGYPYAYAWAAHTRMGSPYAYGLSVRVWAAHMHMGQPIRVWAEYLYGTEHNYTRFGCDPEFVICRSHVHYNNYDVGITMVRS